MHVLLTGSTSQHCHPPMHANIANYSGLLHAALTTMGHRVVWSEPSVTWTAKDLSEYDLVIVGLSPVTSLAANRIYGALSLLDLVPDERLVVLVDAPHPDRIAFSLRSIIRTRSNLLKPFYNNRREYELALRHEARLYNTVVRLHTEPWPTTLVPKLPWHVSAELAELMPYPMQRFGALNLDAMLDARLDLLDDSTDRHAAWVIDGSPHAPISWQQTPIPRKGATGWDNSVMRQMAAASGVLLEVPKTGTWWSSRYLQSLATRTPVFSSWRETGRIGGEWLVLPQSIETMHPAYRTELATAQRTSYLNSIPDLMKLKQAISTLAPKENHAAVW